MDTYKLKTIKLNVTKFSAPDEAPRDGESEDVIRRQNEALEKWRLENNSPNGFPTEEITVSYVPLDSFSDKTSGGGFEFCSIILPNS